jgi:CRP-like cAMP-binding protein
MAKSPHISRPPKVPDGAMAKLFGSGQKISITKGEIVLRPDDEPPGVFYIESGYVKVFSINDRGEEYLHVVYGPGDIFPIIWAVFQKHRNVFYRTLSSTKLLHISENKFVEEIKGDPEVCFAVLQEVTSQFNVYSIRLDNLEYKYGRERLAYRLLFLASNLGIRHNDTIILPPVTQQDIASSINLSRESASREIERLEKRGLVSYQGRRIVVNDIEALSREIKGVDLKRWGLR